MAHSKKKVIVRTIRDSLHPGYLPPDHLVGGAEGRLSVDLLDLSGRITPIALPSIRTIAFVREFNLANTIDPEQLTRRTFLARPRSEGLWVRLGLLGGEVLEGLTSTDLSLFDAVMEERGLFMTPPDLRSNTQRLFIPRSAISTLELIAVVTTPSKKLPGKQPKTRDRADQTLLFPNS